mgnify:CR=1 FL=1
MSVKIRRITAFLLALSLLCTLAVQTAFAAPVAADYKFEGGSVTVDGTEDKTVDVNFISVKGDEYYAFQADWSKKELEDTSYFTLTALTPGGTASPMEDDPNTGHTYWVEGTFNAPIVVAAGGTIWKATYTVAKDTPSGTYTFSLKVPSIADGSFDGADVGTFTAAVTVTNNTPAADGYTVAVSMANTKINTGDTAMVKLAISNPNVAYYNAVDMKLTYDANVLSFDKTKSTGLPTDATVTDANGSLRIQFYGENRTDALQLAFTGIAAGESEVKVAEAKIDKSENALKNAPAATVTGSATITVGQTYTVNRDTNVVDGNPKAEAGKDYTFKLANGLDGTYMDVSYTVDGVEKGTLKQGADGSYTIPAGEITGDITITAVGKKFDVTVDTTASGAGNVTLTDGSKATYGTNYTFTLTPEANYAYTVTVTADGKPVTPTPGADGKTYTINGKDITGNVVITVTKAANKAQINFRGSGLADVVDGSTSRTAEPGQDFKFSINKENGYAYTVTATKKDGTAVTVTDNGDGTYTIAGADIKAGDVIAITVEKELIETKYTVVVNEFVKIGANAEGKPQSVFLITAKLNAGVTLADGKVLAYGNNTMFQNAKRYDGAYAYLVISDKTLDEVKAEAEKAGQITEVDGTAQTFNVNGDVNGTGLVDINDAQLVYNIYKVKYDSFNNTTMAMFLAADMNGSKRVDVNDAAAVVAKIQ